MTPKDFSIGQQVLEFRGDQCAPVVVKTVGRRWIVVNDEANGLDYFDRSFDGFTLQGKDRNYRKYYLSFEHRERVLRDERTKREADDAWKNLRTYIPWMRPDHLDAAAIAAIDAIIKGGSK